VSNDLTLGDSALRYVERCHGVARRLKAHSPASRVTTAEAPAKAAEFGVVKDPSPARHGLPLRLRWHHDRCTSDNCRLDAPPKSAESGQEPTSMGAVFTAAAIEA
jgi:hypothetical protein